MEQKVKITWLGTAAIRLEADGETVLFDPFVQLVSWSVGKIRTVWMTFYRIRRSV